MQVEQIYEKKNWPVGPWINEPDKAFWVDGKTGLNCLIVRNRSGALCGYVGVDKSHKYYACNYSDDVVGDVNVHWGLTYSDFCQGNICHPHDNESDEKIWWFGFDCAHFRDLVPLHNEFHVNFFEGETYRDFEFVMREVTSLAHQLFELK